MPVIYLAHCCVALDRVYSRQELAEDPEYEREVLRQTVSFGVLYEMISQICVLCSNMHVIMNQRYSASEQVE